MGKYDAAMSMALGVPLSEPVILPRSEIAIADENPVAVLEPKSESGSSEDKEFDDVKTNLEGILGKAEYALATLTSLAISEESPRAFEVLNTMLNSMVDINMKMIEIEERKAKLKKLRAADNADKSPTPGSLNLVAGSGETTVNNNVVFVGTTKELQEQLRQQMTGK
jgi:hypothetical protein